MSTLTLRQLQYFLAVAELRHFGRAAGRCCVTQPALSPQIRELEETLGVRLLDRRRGHLDLTDEGRDMVHHAMAILTAVREMQECARGQSRNPVGTLRLGLIPSLAPYMLPQLLPELRAAHPGLQTEIHEQITQVLVAGLLEGRLDAIVVAGPSDDPQIDSMELFEDRFLLARRRAANGKPPPAASETIRTERLLLLHDGHCLRDQAISYCASVTQPVLSEFGASSLATIMRMVASGYGVTLLPEIAADAESADARIELVALDPPVPRRKITLMWRVTSARKRDLRAIGALMARACAPRPRPLPLPVDTAGVPGGRPAKDSAAYP